MPLPCLAIANTLQESTLERGLHCLGCVRALCDRTQPSRDGYCTGCQISRPGGSDILISKIDLYRLKKDEMVTCKTVVDRGRLYAKSEILTHIRECGNAQDYLADLNLERKRFSEVEA